jgi:hypothetical protein
MIWQDEFTLDYTQHAVIRYKQRFDKPSSERKAFAKEIIRDGEFLGKEFNFREMDDLEKYQLGDNVVVVCRSADTVDALVVTLYKNT